MGLIIPKNNADPQTLDATLQIYYEAADWVENARLIESLSEKLISLGLEEIQKEPQSYTKKTQVLAYFGFIVWEDLANSQSRRKITDLGRRFYEARKEHNQEKIIDILMESLQTQTFGRNVIGCDSDSDIEAPNIFIKASVLLEGLSNKEFAYIIQKMELEHEDFSNSVFQVKLLRLKGEKIKLNAAATKWSDPKPITALKNWGFLDNNNDNVISQLVLEKHSKEIMNLRTYNTEISKKTTIKGFSMEETLNMDNLKNFYLSAIRTKPFILLAGISGTGKSRIVRRLAQASVTEELQKKYDKKSVENGFDRWKLHKPANFELIQVKPNWHNSMEVVGYKSNINGAHYEFTPFIEFVTRAWLHPTVPFFLCLDEMNLAPVEQYFAEFLSAIESRTKENGEYMTDPIIKPFVSFGEKLCDDMLNAILPTVSPSETGTPFAKRIEFLKGHFKEKGLTLPENFIVMGTVNMDETTFSFSRKVLDRAMSIVMNDVNLEDYFSNQSDVITSELSDDTISALINRPISGLEVIDDDSQTVREFFEAVNIILDGTPFKLGYRAISEALLYVSAAKVFGCESMTNALDQFTMMKIISRIEGDKRSIGNLLGELQKVITTDFEQSNKKLQSMAKTLNDSQFVSYWT